MDYSRRRVPSSSTSQQLLNFRRTRRPAPISAPNTLPDGPAKTPTGPSSCRRTSSPVDDSPPFLKVNLDHIARREVLNLRDGRSRAKVQAMPRYNRDCPAHPLLHDQRNSRHNPIRELSIQNLKARPLFPLPAEAETLIPNHPKLVQSGIQPNPNLFEDLRLFTLLIVFHVALFPALVVVPPESPSHSPVRLLAQLLCLLCFWVIVGRRCVSNAGPDDDTR